ncbi:hypothetical protein DYI24_02475 [Rhodopseudomonas sp. BR0C11]|uniref:hypothetical protein n=1 Tax=Rhodopseudomonas sp. BR0C11 TaxID=2269370 RepID=UPI0013DF3C15|nr:hypothetical protein [Rhodopseudomonas sp. BR0C11]NEV75910.1 hypothetical protein [Rhodopseudomonas sp. BR0C11]
MTARSSEQLGFGELLAEAERQNDHQQQRREAAHLPDTLEKAVPYMRGLIDRHHAAMLEADEAKAMALRAEADLLANKLNAFEPGILAGPDAPGCILDRETRAREDEVPLWGQSGCFEITVLDMRARIELEGIFGIASSVVAWLGFAAHAVDRDKPFISQTGYRSFLGLSGDLVPNLTPDEFVRNVITAHIIRDLKGKLVPIKPNHRGSASGG